MTAFLALLHRDLTVAARQAPFLLLATLRIGTAKTNQRFRSRNPT